VTAPALPEGDRSRRLPHQLDKAAAGLLGVAMTAQSLRRAVIQRVGGQAEIAGPDEFQLAHRDAPGELVQIFAEADLQDQPFHLAKTSVGVETEGPSLQLAQCLGIGRHPGKPVGQRLVCLHQRGRYATILPYQGADDCIGLVKQVLDRAQGRGGQCQRLGQQGGARLRFGNGLAIMHVRLLPGLRMPEI